MKYKENIKLKKLILTAMLIAVGMVLPFLTGQIPQIGKMLLPMHIPILLCGMLCGTYYGYTAGLVLPILRSLCFGQPAMFPTAVAMSVELAVYGLTAGLVFTLIKKKNILNVYISLISAMLLGRVISGMAKVVLYGTEGSPYTMEMFVAGSFANALPGIILQLIAIPAVMGVLFKINRKTGWL